MRIRLRNILKIGKADLKIGGLTVITGCNDSGKSTVGKVVFICVKSLCDYLRNNKTALKLSVKHNVDRLLRVVRNSHAEIAGIPNDPVELCDVLLKGELTGAELEVAVMTHIIGGGYPSRFKALLMERVSDITDCLGKLKSPIKVFEENFRKLAVSEFREPLSSFGTASSYIRFDDDLAEDGEAFVEVKFEEGKLKETTVEGRTCLKDITYVESSVFMPVLASLCEIGRFTRDEHNPSEIPYHLVDLANKILAGSQNPDMFAPEQLQLQKLLDEMQRTTDGRFAVDDDKKEIKFSSDGHDIPVASVATGLKTFGVIQRLIETGNLSPYKMLVFDEPEIHLHPEWQLVLCRVIAGLVSTGVPVMISTHSPYFVQGLRYYASELGIERETSYYLAEEGEKGLTRMVEVTDDLNRVFTLLAAPLRKVMNVGEK